MFNILYMPRSTRKNRKLPKSRTPIKKKLTKKKQCGGSWFKKKTYTSCTQYLLHEEKLLFNYDDDNNKLIDSIVKELKNSPAYLAQKCMTYITDNAADASEIACVYIHYNKVADEPYVKLEFFSQKNKLFNISGSGEDYTVLQCKPFHIKIIDDSKVVSQTNTSTTTSIANHILSSYPE